MGVTVGVFWTRSDAFCRPGPEIASSSPDMGVNIWSLKIITEYKVFLFIRRNIPKLGI